MPARNHRDISSPVENLLAAGGRVRPGFFPAHAMPKGCVSMGISFVSQKMHHFPTSYIIQIPAGQVNIPMATFSGADAFSPRKAGQPPAKGGCPSRFILARSLQPCGIGPPQSGGRELAGWLPGEGINKMGKTDSPGSCHPARRHPHSRHSRLCCRHPPARSGWCRYPHQALPLQ